jgi:hypothetical protein
MGGREYQTSIAVALDAQSKSKYQPEHSIPAIDSGVV